MFAGAGLFAPRFRAELESVVGYLQYNGHSGVARSATGKKPNTAAAQDQFLYQFDY